MVYLSYFFVIITIIGLVLNVKKNKYNFYFLMSANLFFIINGILNNSMYEIFLFSAYFCLGIYGMIEWNKKQ
jgi:hypothetical protein